MTTAQAGGGSDRKEIDWYRDVYQGDRVAQLTVRSVVMGALLGMLMSVSNLYTTMKVGWSFGVAITACVLSFVIWNALRALSAGRLTPMSILENNCMQSTAGAAGAATGNTIATSFGALLILDPRHRHLAWPVVAAFTLLTGSLGVFLAVPVKRQLINHEQLPFPSGIAAATTLKSLYAGDADTLRKAYSLIVALVTGAVVGVLNTAEDQFAALGRFFAWMKARLFDVHLPDLIPETGLRLLDGKPMVGFGFEPSALLVSAGMLVGMRVSLSMFAASAALYFGVAPWLHARDVASAGMPGYLVSIPTAGGGALFHPVRWALWGGVAVMVFAGLTSLALQWRTIVRSLLMLRGRTAQSADAGLEARMAQIEVPNRWFVAGVVPISLALIALQMIAFEIRWWAGLISVAASFALVLVSCRVTGETDITPVGPLGKVMQLLFAVVSPGNVTHNLVSAGAGANSVAAAGELLIDLKSGYLLGANPRRQFLAQFTGVFFGTLAVVPAWYLMIPNVAALERYPLPATQVWVAVARVLSAGVDGLPQTARVAILVGALLGMALPVLEKLCPRARPWLPSPIGLGLGWVVSFANTLSFAIGAVFVAVWGVLHLKSRETFCVPIASGLIAGESILKATLAMLATVLGLSAAAATAVPGGQDGSNELLQSRTHEATEAERAFARTMSDRDLERFAGFVSEDAVFRQRDRLLVGRAAVVEGWRDWFKPGAAPFSWEPDRVTVDRAGDTAISSGPVRDPAGTVIGRFTTVWRRQVAPDGDARWQVIVDQGVPLIGCAPPKP